jgi:hypothetical protein
MATITDTDIFTLETLVDNLGLDHVLDALATVCFEKAGHLESNWQDSASARLWRRAGKSIDTLTNKPAIQSVS